MTLHSNVYLVVLKFVILDKKQIVSVRIPGPEKLDSDHIMKLVHLWSNIIHYVTPVIIILFRKKFKIAPQKDFIINKPVLYSRVDVVTIEGIIMKYKGIWFQLKSIMKILETITYVYEHSWHARSCLFCYFTTHKKVLTTIKTHVTTY